MIADVVEQHFDELDFLSGQWREAIRSAEYLPQEVAELVSRISAHVKALRYAGDQCVPFAASRLGQSDPDAVFAGAYLLLQFDNTATVARVIEVFVKARDAQLEGLVNALCQCPVERAECELMNAMETSAASVASAAAEVLAFHKRLEPGHSRLLEFINNDDPKVRQRAWRVVAMLGQ